MTGSANGQRLEATLTWVEKQLGRIGLTNVRRSQIAAVGMLLGGLAIAVLLSVTAGRSEPVLPSEKAWPVSSMIAAPGPLAPTFAAFGKVESNDVARLRTSVDAPVAEILAREGEWATAGQLLVRLDDREIALQLAQEDAELNREVAILAAIRTEEGSLRRILSRQQEMARLATGKMRRHEELFRTGMISQALLDQVREQSARAAIELETQRARIADLPHRLAQQEAQVDKARARRNHRQLQVDQTRLVAPFAGPVLSVAVARGDRSANLPLLVIANGEDIAIRVAIDEGLRRQMQRQQALGVRATTTVDGQLIPLVLDRLGGDVKVGQGATDAFFVPDAPTDEYPAPRLVLGRVLDLRIQLPLAEQAVAVPIQSLYGDNRIYQVINHRLVPITVERLGDFTTSEGQYRVLVRAPELTGGQEIVTTQLPRAITGLLVEPAGSVRGATSPPADTGRGATTPSSAGATENPSPGPASQVQRPASGATSGNPASGNTAAR